jgi:hypothetical protein
MIKMMIRVHELSLCATRAEPIEAGAVRVIDGDMIPPFLAQRTALIGFDAPRPSAMRQ